MHDITLYGHLTVDRIFDGFEERQTLGAMANMWRTFKQIAPDLDVGLVPTSIGEAMVYIDRQSCTRYSNFVPDLKTNSPIIKETKIENFQSPQPDLEPRHSNEKVLFYTFCGEVLPLLRNLNFLRYTK